MNPSVPYLWSWNNLPLVTGKREIERRRKNAYLIYLCSSTHGSVDPSPRDLLQSEPSALGLSYGSGLALNNRPASVTESRSSDSSPRKKKFFSLVRGPKSKDRFHKGSPESSGTPSPVLSPRSEDALPDVTSSSPNHQSSSFFKRSESSRASSDGTSSPSPQSSVTGRRGSLSLKGQGKVERIRKKDEKKALQDARKQERLQRKEADEFIDLVLQNALVFPMEELFKELPRLKLVVNRSAEPILICSGPTPHDDTVAQNGTAQAVRCAVEVSGRTVSTYPMLPGNQVCFSSCYFSCSNISPFLCFSPLNRDEKVILFATLILLRFRKTVS